MLRTLLSEFRVPNHIRSAVSGSLFLRYPCYKCDVCVWRSLLIAQTHNADDAEGIRAMILSDECFKTISKDFQTRQKNE